MVFGKVANDMSNYKKVHIQDIPLEDAHGGTGKRQVLVSPADVQSAHLEAVTKGFLAVGNSYDWHTHEDTDEIAIVIKGEGKFYCEEEETQYSQGDILITSPNVKHKITALGDSSSEFYFIRVK